MGWNTALALIPVLLTVFFFKRENQPLKRIRNMTFAFELALVLLFLPNAPYVATDLVHFLYTVRSGDSPLWRLLGTEFPLYTAFVIFGLACYSFSVDRLFFAILMRMGKAWSWAAFICIPLLSAIGVYLGRVARYNSWDILTDPKGIIHSGEAAWDKVRVLKVILFMWAALIVVHQIYRLFHDGIRYRIEAQAKGRKSAMDS